MREKTGSAGDLARLLPDMTAWRRHLHMHPELSFREVRTSAWIAERLREFGCDEVRTGVGGTGVVAVIRGSRPGPAIALRADIDALPIQDEKDVPYRSTVPGVMHACGHDAHTAALLGVAAHYAAKRNGMAGERRLIFQPAEEMTPGGAVGMIEGGALDGVSAIYGVHLWTPLPVGTVASAPGPVMATEDEFELEFRGRGGHGGMPHETVDAIAAGAAFVQGVQTIVSRSVDPLEPAVVSIGMFHAGSAPNIIAEVCRLSGTVRTFDMNVRERVRERLQASAEAVCRQFGAEYSLDWRHGYPPVVNDEREAERFFAVARGLFGEEAVRRIRPFMTSEDFAYYLQRVPGCFMFVGAGNAECGAAWPHHHPRFDIDERAMLQAARLLVAMAEHRAEEAASA
ncbi:MAG: peptidase M20 [Thermobacillus sp. ZCTH02-B1]|uniref:M20 metallopeptidase family protein n=1 Tax=Thermobacillus sp. ZCTH02-B1 TaxID=1858795 RepID=UPI000B57B802|nr:amidohydrolase [Thermobacillus sp. ZCTH02-B1]OUM96454.1 MAG: peptidase M20 [Thermobacillus sp. ZCTH02-B1]